MCVRERESRRHVRRDHDDFNGVWERERAGGMSGEVMMISMTCVWEREQEACQERSRWFQWRVRERERAGGMSGEVTMISMACVWERERESRRHVRRGHDDFNGVCVWERESRRHVRRGHDDFNGVWEREREQEACQERSRWFQWRVCERERESRRHVRRGHDDFNGVCVREREQEACQERSRWFQWRVWERERERAGGMSGEVTMISMACVWEREREQEACQERSRWFQWRVCERESRRHARRGHDDFNGVCVCLCVVEKRKNRLPVAVIKPSSQEVKSENSFILDGSGRVPSWHSETHWYVRYGNYLMTYVFLLCLLLCILQSTSTLHTSMLLQTSDYMTFHGEITASIFNCILIILCL